MSEAEFSRVVRAYPQPPEALAVTASEAERAALTRRLGIVAIHSLTAELTFSPEGSAISAKGRLAAELTQNCAVSGDDFATLVEEPLDLRFVPAGSLVVSDEEIEFDSGQADEIEFEGDSFDLGEAVAQSLGLAIDPYAEGPGADEARRNAGIAEESEPRGPLADLLQELKRG